eukprot:Ihof_evm3s88 gene=Ihof_evmTU3s88
MNDYNGHQHAVQRRSALPVTDSPVCDKRIDTYNNICNNMYNLLGEGQKNNNKLRSVIEPGDEYEVGEPNIQGSPVLANINSMLYDASMAMLDNGKHIGDEYGDSIHLYSVMKQFDECQTNNLFETCDQVGTYNLKMEECMQQEKPQSMVEDRSRIRFNKTGLHVGMGQGGAKEIGIPLVNSEERVDIVGVTEGGLGGNNQYYSRLNQLENYQACVSTITRGFAATECNIGIGEIEQEKGINDSMGLIRDVDRDSSTLLSIADHSHQGVVLQSPMEPLGNNERIISFLDNSPIENPRFWFTYNAPMENPELLVNHRKKLKIHRTKAVKQSTPIVDAPIERRELLLSACDLISLQNNLGIPLDTLSERLANESTLRKFSQQELKQIINFLRHKYQRTMLMIGKKPSLIYRIANIIFAPLPSQPTNSQPDLNNSNVPDTVRTTPPQKPSKCGDLQQLVDQPSYISSRSPLWHCDRVIAAQPYGLGVTNSNIVCIHFTLNSTDISMLRANHHIHLRLFSRRKHCDEWWDPALSLRIGSTTITILNRNKGINTAHSGLPHDITIPILANLPPSFIMETSTTTSNSMSSCSITTLSTDSTLSCHDSISSIFSIGTQSTEIESTNSNTSDISPIESSLTDKDPLGTISSTSAIGTQSTEIATTISNTSDISPIESSLTDKDPLGTISSTSSIGTQIPDITTTGSNTSDISPIESSLTDKDLLGTTASIPMTTSHEVTLRLVYPHNHTLNYDGGVMTVELVRENTVNELSAMCPHVFGTCRPDEDVVALGSTVTLRCPISFSLIGCPVRGRTCMHEQCFDLQAYVRYCSTTGLWNCPVCRHHLPFT